MPTQNPRLTVTLSESTALLLRRLSELTGDSQSKLVAEILAESSPVFERMILVMEAAQKAKEAVRTGTAERLKEAQQKIEGQLGLALGEFDDLTGSLFEEAERVTRRARAVADAPARPQKTARGGGLKGRSDALVASPTPLSNRGVRYPADTVNKSSTRSKRGG